jgi:mono/diheme cytochrome c family protein
LDVRKFLVVSTLFVLTTAAAYAADAKAGQAAYLKACKSCHGADGTPNPAMVKALKVDMKDLKSADVQAESDDKLKSAITMGVGKMKPVASASAEADDIVAFIRTWKK